MVREKQVQERVKRVYRAAGCVVYDTSQPRAAMVTAGLPDLLVFCDRKGKFWFHEVKSPTGRQSSEQQAFEDHCELCAQAYVIGGVDEAVAQLRAIGIVVQPGQPVRAA